MRRGNPLIYSAGWRSDSAVAHRVHGRIIKMINRLLVVGTFISIVGAPAFGQVKLTTLQTNDFPSGYTTMVGVWEIAPGTCAGARTHPGVETSYILEGEATLKIGGQPDRKLKVSHQRHRTMPALRQDRV
jgi:hypothetical protein